MEFRENVQQRVTSGTFTKTDEPKSWTFFSVRNRELFGTTEHQLKGWLHYNSDSVLL